jgi:hypothetical protein
MVAIPIADSLQIVQFKPQKSQQLVKTFTHLSQFLVDQVMTRLFLLVAFLGQFLSNGCNIVFVRIGIVVVPKFPTIFLDEEPSAVGVEPSLLSRARVLPSRFPLVEKGKLGASRPSWGTTSFTIFALAHLEWWRIVKWGLCRLGGINSTLIT